MTDHETRVRKAAIALHDAITGASCAGLRVTWPMAVSGLASIAVSATAKAITVPDEAPVSARKSKRDV